MKFILRELLLQICHKKPIGQKGIADILGCWKGRLIAIEVKTPRGKLSEKQEQFLMEVNAAGGLGFVARSVEDVMRELEGKDG